MDLVVFNAAELVAVARALRNVARTTSAFSPREADFIAAIAALHGVVLEPHALTPIAPPELARAVTDPHRRKRALQLLVVMSLVEGEAQHHSEEALARFASALEVDEAALAVLREVSEGHLLLARFDMIRRLRGTLLREQTLQTLKSMATAAIFGEDHETAEKYRALAMYPEGSLGRVLFDSWREHGFKLPGEKGAMPERGVFHDVGHILSGYDVDPKGEIRQGAFQAGFVRKDGFAFLLFAILQFHIGVKITPIAKAEKGYFDAREVLRAVARGAACNVDLSDPEQWDFWSVAHVPVDELRARYGVPPMIEAA
jgi:ubiquinone biosynthesis protein Coq4